MRSSDISKHTKIKRKVPLFLISKDVGGGGGDNDERDGGEGDDYDGEGDDNDDKADDDGGLNYSLCWFKRPSS